MAGSIGIFLFSVLTLSILGSVSSQAALGGDCSDGNGCNTTDLVCDIATNLCKVKADGSSTDCGSDNANCTANAACTVTTCSCNAGYTNFNNTGLCGVLGADCSNVTACGDTTNYVCDAMAGSKCRVKANGIATNCFSTGSNCPNHGMCGTTTCSCESGYKEAAGLCVAEIGSTCTSDSDCSAVLTNSVCRVISPCSKGECQCAAGYYWTDCLKLGYDKSCNTGTDKCHTGMGLACDATSTKCACSTTGHTYKAAIKACTDKMLFGETCATVANCNVASNEMGACTDFKCACASGYTMEVNYSGMQMCRLPYADETGCSSTCGKLPFFQESSQVTPTCTNDKCGCAASGESLISFQRGGVCFNYCITDLASGVSEKDSGATCSNLNECKSKFCFQCPGDANAKCMDAPCTTSNGVKITVNGIAFCLSIILLSYLY